MSSRSRNYWFSLLAGPALAMTFILLSGCRSTLSASEEWFRPAEVALPESETVFSLSRLDEFYALESHFEGLGPYPLVLDTAGGRLMVGQEIEDALLAKKTRKTGPLYLDWPEGRREIGRFFKVSSAHLGPVAFRDLGVCSTDFGAWREQIGRAPQGFVGIHLFRGKFVTIDFRTGTMTIRNSAPESLPPPEAEVPFRWLLDTVVEAKITIAGKPTWAVIDSGSSLGLQIPPDGSFPIVDRWQPWGEVRDLQGLKTYSVARVRGDTRIGDTQLPDAWAFSHSKFLESPTIGMGLLRHFRMTLDTEGGLLWLEGPEDGQLVVPEPRPQTSRLRHSDS